MPARAIVEGPLPKKQLGPVLSHGAQTTGSVPASMLAIHRLDRAPGDPLDRDRTLAICELIRRRGLKIVWEIRTRPERLARAGCYRICIGVEMPAWWAALKASLTCSTV